MEWVRGLDKGTLMLDNLILLSITAGSSPVLIILGTMAGAIMQTNSPTRYIYGMAWRLNFATKLWTTGHDDSNSRRESFGASILLTLR